MVTEEIKLEIEHIKKLFGTPRKDRYEQNDFMNKIRKRDTIYNSFKRDMVDKNNKRFK